VDINEIAEENPDTVVTITIPAGDGIPPFILQYAVDKAGLDGELAEQF